MAVDDHKPDLSTCTTQELIDELDRRSEYFVFATVLKIDYRPSGRYVSSFWYEGGWHRAYGLLAEMRQTMSREHHRKKEE